MKWRTDGWTETRAGTRIDRRGEPPAGHEGARRNAESGCYSFEIDPDLVTLTRDSNESLTDTRNRTDRLEERLSHRNDRRAVFLTIYTNIPLAVQNGIGGGTVTDPAWMRNYTVAFANYYREALLAFERGRV